MNAKSHDSRGGQCCARTQPESAGYAKMVCNEPPKKRTGPNRCLSHGNKNSLHSLELAWRGAKQ